MQKSWLQGWINKNHWPTYKLKRQTKQIIKVSSSSSSSGMDNLGIILSLNRTLALQLGHETLPSGPLLRIDQLLKQWVWNLCRHSTKITMKCLYSISSWHGTIFTAESKRWVERITLLFFFEEIFDRWMHVFRRYCSLKLLLLLNCLNFLTFALIGYMISNGYNTFLSTPSHRRFSFLFLLITP